MLVAEIVEPYVRGRVRQGEIVALTARNHRMVLGQFGSSARCETGRLSERHVRHWLEDYDYLAAIDPEEPPGGGADVLPVAPRRGPV